MVLIAIILFLVSGISFFLAELRSAQAAGTWHVINHPVVLMYLAFVDVSFWWMFTLVAASVDLLNLLVHLVNRSDK